MCATNQPNSGNWQTQLCGSSSVSLPHELRAHAGLARSADRDSARSRLRSRASGQSSSTIGWATNGRRSAATCSGKLANVVRPRRSVLRTEPPPRAQSNSTASTRGSASEPVGTRIEAVRHKSLSISKWMPTPPTCREPTGRARSSCTTPRDGTIAADGRRGSWGATVAGRRRRRMHVAILARVADRLFDRVRRAWPSQLAQRAALDIVISSCEIAADWRRRSRQQLARRLDERLTVFLRCTQSPILGSFSHQHGSCVQPVCEMQEWTSRWRRPMATINRNTDLAVRTRRFHVIASAAFTAAIARSNTSMIIFESLCGHRRGCRRSCVLLPGRSAAPALRRFATGDVRPAPTARAAWRSRDR